MLISSVSRIPECTTDSWSPGIGDPGFAGWFTVLAYLAAAGFALALDMKRDWPALERTFWALSSAGLLFLAVNKQLDLQSLLTAVGRCTAKVQGWYDMRRTVQIDFILAMISMAVMAGLAVLWILRHSIRRIGIALLGLVWITGFVLVRAVGFHDVDRLIGMKVADMRLNWVFELGGIAVFILGCAIALMAGRPADATR